MSDPVLMSSSKRIKTEYQPADKNTLSDATYAASTVSEELFHLLVEYLPCWELPNVASVCKEWRSAASASYYARLDAPWDLPQANITLTDGEKEAKLKIYYDATVEPALRGLHQQLEQRKFLEKIQKKSTPYVTIDEQEEGGKKQWRINLRDEQGHPEVVPYLPLLPLEQDLPEALRHEDTQIEHASLARGLLLLVVSRHWTPVYAKALSNSGLEDHYQFFADSHPEAMAVEEDDWGDWIGEFVEHNWDDETVRMPGSDLWGLLCQVSKTNVPKLVDMQRLAQKDFINTDVDDSFLNLERSQNGKVLCMETGIFNPADPNRCIPNIHTFHLSSDKGFQKKHAPLAWPCPCGMEEIYSSFLILSPCGDYLLASYSQDVDEIEDTVLCKFKHDANNDTDTWEKCWEESNASFDGFFTPDGDFVVVENGNHWQSAPGFLTAKRILAINPSEHWLRHHALFEQLGA